MRSFHTRYAMVTSKWFLEQTTADEGSFHSIEEVIFSGSSDYQRIEIIETGSYGKCLVLDGKIQSCAADEFIYHEALAHPAMVLSALPRRILVAGGGEGATTREVLRHPSVSEVAIVDLDKVVVEVCEKYLPEWHMGAMRDKKTEVFFEDARKFIESSENFDVIILDLPEPTKGGPAFMLYTKEFYEIVYRRLNDGGVVVTQAASTSVNNLEVFTAIVNTMRQVFPVIRPYTANIPSFYAPWGFVLASRENDPLNLSPGNIKARLDNLEGSLKFYDDETHQGMFCLPRYLRDSIAKGSVIITDASPLSFY